MNVLDGVLLVDKPGGMTSFDVVRRLRRVSGERRIGHCGTLDPMATGLLVVCFGWSTRLVPWLTSDRKAYEAVVRLGTTTTTDDREGEELAVREVPELTLERIESELDRYRGTIEQTPPRYSAIHVEGRRAHALARAGESFELPAREVTVHACRVEAWNPPDLTLSLDVSKGTYIRSIARDLGESLGCGGHLVALRRSESGVFDVRDAVELEAAEARFPSERLLSPWNALAGMPVLEVSEEERRRLRVGQKLQRSVGEEGTYRVCDADGGLLALVSLEGLGSDGFLVRPQRLVPEPRRGDTTG